ncbi:hypothetical protein BGZ76_009651 [Entomortierella beljakovae]|nr:hypothetical protein BGZ76_009651 [Entomortierella beljakovae]
MGNSVSTVTPSAATAGIDSYVSELGDIHYEKRQEFLGSARFMKTIRGRQKEGSVVVKIFVKPETGFPLKRIVKVLNGLADSHAKNVFHGDIKTENCLVTSWNWVYLSDFAGYKPTFLPEDNPADFSFFFDTSLRRICYLAPERFYKPGVDIEKQRQAENPENIFTGLTAAMDIFSVGCVIAELFSEGTPIFSLSQMFRYRSGEYDPTPYINKIEDDHIKEMIRHMIQLDPSKRSSADQYLSDWRDLAFPKYFYTFLHQYIHSVTESAGESSSSSALDAILLLTQEQNEPRPKTDADEKIERIYHDLDKISFFLGLETPQSSELNQGEILASYGKTSSNKKLPLRHKYDFV